MRLQGKKVIVTGSSTGIGQAIARRCADEGGSVLVHGLEAELCEEVAKNIGPASRWIAADLSETASASRIVSAMIAAFGGIDAVVNNAAWIVRSDIQTTDAATFDRAMAVNVRAPMLLIQAALPFLKDSRGSVLNIGSVNAYCGEKNQLAYAVSKGALMTLTRNLADALCGDGVRVNQLNPGWVLSENERLLKIREGMPADWHEHPPRAFAPSGKLIQPSEIAAAAVYWLSDESRPISGSVVDLDQFPVIGRNPVK